MPRKPKSNPEEHPLFHDTFQLLKSYRDVRWSVEVSCSDLHQEFQSAFGMRIDECLATLENMGADFQGTNIESHARTIVRSRKMLSLIDSALGIMRAKHKRGELYYWILYYTYISPQEYGSADQIIKLLNKQFKNMSLRTYYLLRKNAIEAFGAILWGYTSRECSSILKKFDRIAAENGVDD